MCAYDMIEQCKKLQIQSILWTTAVWRHLVTHLVTQRGPYATHVHANQENRLLLL